MPTPRRPRHRFSDAQLDWLHAMYPLLRAAALVEPFNARFGTSLSAQQIRNALSKHRISNGGRRGFVAGEATRTYTREHIDWLRARRPLAPLADVARAFRAHFGLSANDSAINGLCNRNGIRAGTSGRFCRGEAPWNKGLAGVTLGGRDTQFKPGVEPHTTRPVGAYTRDRDGYWKLKVSDHYSPGNSSTNWRFVHRLTWEAAHGPIPRGHAVILIDGDTDNCLSADNLACVDRATLALLNQRGWGEVRDRDARLAMLALARLDSAINRQARRIGMTKTDLRKVRGTNGEHDERRA